MASPLPFPFLKKSALLGLLALAGSRWAQAQTITVDGSRDAAYPAALAVQTVGTTYGDNNLASPAFANGSELDNLHARIVGNDLYLFIGGNLESNFNHLDLFFDTRAGGQNVLANNPNYVGNMNGLQFDAGFAADYALTIGAGNNPLEVYANYARLPTGGGGNSFDFVGGGVGRSHVLNFGNVLAGSGTGQVALDNSNVAGVGQGTAAANAAAAAAVGTGLELRIPLSALGTAAGGGEIRLMAFVNAGDWRFLGNQVLAGLPATYGQLGTAATVNFAAYPGNQFATLDNGPVRIDGTVEPGFYGAAKVLQINPTGFGDNTATTPGSELDGAYARVEGDALYVALTGNLEGNNNRLLLFFDADPETGQNTLLGTNPTVDFGASANLAGLRFDRGFAPESFLTLSVDGSNVNASFALLNGAGGSGTYLSQTPEPAQLLTFSGGQTGLLAFDNANTAGVSGTAVNNPAAVATGVELRLPLSVLGASITATTPLHVAAVLANPFYDYLSNQTLGGLPAGTANLGQNNTRPSAVDFGAMAGNQFFTARRGNLTVGDTRFVAGDYRDLTVAGTGRVNMTSPLDVDGTLRVQSSGQLLTSCGNPLTGTGSFVLEDGGGLLGICDVDGLSASGNTGTIRVSGARTFSDDAFYQYIGPENGAPQITGSGLPTRVRSLTVASNGAALRLSRPLGIRQVLSLAVGLDPSGQVLTLLSSASGASSTAALVVNQGGTVLGPATVQRAIGSANTGPGYRHYSAPVRNTTFNDLSTPGFAPALSQAAAYNSSATPALVVPFPNVFGYDESRVLTSPATGFSSFDKGWFAPTAAAMAVGTGYTVNIGASEVVDFVGTLNDGDLALTLPRAGGPDGGWHLVGNPYPAPLDYSRVAAADRSGLEPAMYVYESSSQYLGSYRTYLPGAPATGTNNPVLASGQGFFVRTATSGTAGALTFRNSQRLTTFGPTTTFRRDAPDLRPVLALALSGAGHTDAVTLYADAQAAAGVDARHDARKLPNSTGLNVAALVAGSELAIDGQPAWLPGLVVPLAVRVPSAGSYTLQASELRSLPAGLTPYLRDAHTGRQVLLTLQASYGFSLTAAEAAALGTGRFSLAFEPAALLAAPASAAASFSLFPNPAQGTVTLQLPAGTGPAQVSLYNALGQLVRTYSPLTATATGTSLNMKGLTAGIYTVRVTAGKWSASQVLAVE